MIFTSDAVNSHEEPNIPKPFSIAVLRTTIEKVAPDARLVDPRVIRRVIRLDRRLTALGFRAPHSKTYTIESTRLLAFVDQTELGSQAKLGPVTILLCRPADPELDYENSRLEILARYWRLLFHARVHLEIEGRYRKAEERQAIAAERLRQLGELEFSEIRSVLLQDKFLFQEPTDWDVYLEFAAVWLDRRYFAPVELAYAFPAIKDGKAVEDLLSQDVHHLDVYQSTRLLPQGEDPTESGQKLPKTDPRLLTQAIQHIVARTRSKSDKLQQRAKRSKLTGNHLKAAISWNLAANSTKGKKSVSLRELAHAELRVLANKLRTSLRQDPSYTAEWTAAFCSVLDGASTGFWVPEARLLYELQKICIEADAGSSRPNLMEWLLTFGREPLTRPLPLLQHVLVSKHIRSAQRRLSKTRLNDLDRQRLSALLVDAEELAEQQLRETVRPLIHQQLDQVGLVAEKLPERVARHKLVEEMLDSMVEYGFTTSSTFRDALSKGDLKLRDVTGPELLFGDQFLSADRGLSKALDGVYRPAPVYLRWSQRLSSLAFGTSLGRFITMHLALPLGGAYLAVEGIQHVLALFRGNIPVELPDPSLGLADDVTTTLPVQQLQSGSSDGVYRVALVLATGLLIHLLMHRPDFRVACSKLCLEIMRWIHRAIVEWPARLLRIRLLDQLLHSPAYAPLRSYVIKPGLLTICLLFAFQLFLPNIDFRNTLILFLCAALFLNSPIGRYSDEWFTDFVMRTVDDLRVRVFGALFQWVMDAFQSLLTGLDRILHALDEWLRFRSRDSRSVKVGKFISGTLWSVVAYFVVLISTLLIEPQINPIKHFPVVTVSHKLLLPMGPFFVAWLSPLIGITQANSLVWSTIWLIPGVFGFLVWELRGNWRLYAANRTNTLQSLAVGPHGESMLTMLRPGFHSGTLPKLYGRLRSAARTQIKQSDKRQLLRNEARLNTLRRCVQHWMERELIELLKLSTTHQQFPLSVTEVLLATNRVQVALRNSSMPESALWISWEEQNKQLVATVTDHQLLKSLPPSHLASFNVALSGLFQRTDVDFVQGSIGKTDEQPISWSTWLRLWSRYPQENA